MPNIPKHGPIEWLSEFFPEGFVIFAKQKNGKYRTLQQRPPNKPDRFLAEMEIEAMEIEKRGNKIVEEKSTLWEDEEE